MTSEVTQATVAVNSEDALRVALTDIFAAWDAHVEANDRTNAAIPPIGATRAEREVYDERSRASEDAKREWYGAMHRFVMNPALRAALSHQAIAAREDSLREALNVGEKFLNACFSAWSCGEPYHRVKTMMDRADEFRASLDNIAALRATDDAGGAK